MTAAGPGHRAAVLGKKVLVWMVRPELLNGVSTSLKGVWGRIWWLWRPLWQVRSCPLPRGHVTGAPSKQKAWIWTGKKKKSKSKQKKTPHCPLQMCFPSRCIQPEGVNSVKPFDIYFQIVFQWCIRNHPPPQPYEWRILTEIQHFSSALILLE